MSQHNGRKINETKKFAYDLWKNLRFCDTFQEN